MAQLFGRETVFLFDDVPLIVGTSPDGKPLRIGLIAGEAVIRYHGDRRDGIEWDYGTITLSGPIKDDPYVKIEPVRLGQTGWELWNWVNQSVTASCADDIVTACEGAPAGE